MPLDDISIKLVCGIWPFRKIKTFRGSCTVWHNAETGERPGTETESQLSEIWWKRTREQKCQET
jgi:hypothetical protein